MNWNPNGAPQDGDSLRFPGGNFTISIGTQNDIVGLKLDSITIGTAFNGTFAGNLIVLSNGVSVADTGLGPAVGFFITPIILAKSQAFDTGDRSSPRLFFRDIDLNGFDLSLNNGGDTKFDGVISGSGNIRQFAGDVVLDPVGNTNTYSGSYKISGGTVFPKAPNAFGSPGNVVQVQSSVLVLSNLNVSQISLQLTMGTVQALGASSWGGSVVVTNFPNGGNSFIQSSNSFVISGPITGPAGLTLTGDQIEFTGNQNNTYSGITVVDCNRLSLNKPGARAIAGFLDVRSFREVAWFQNLQASGAPITISASGLLNLNNFSDDLGALDLAGGTISTGSGQASLHQRIAVSPSTIPSQISGIINLPSSAYPNNSFNVTNHSSGAGGLIVNASIVGSGALIKRGPGIMVVNGFTSYTGATFVDEGILQSTSAFPLGTSAGSTIVQDGATVWLNYSGVISEPMSLRGAGWGGTNGALKVSGALNFRSSSPSIFACLDLTTNVTIRVESGGRLTADGFISGTGPLIKMGAGTLVYSNANPNTYIGDTLVKEGTLELRKPSNTISIPGHLTIGPASASSPATTRWFQTGAMNGNSNFVVNANSLLDLNGNNQNLRLLTLNDGGDVQTGAGNANFLSGSSVQVGSLDPMGSHDSSIFSGRIGLPANETLVFAVAGYAPGPPFGAGAELEMSAQIPVPVENVNFERAGIWKTGSGEMRLTGNNSFNGRADVIAGTLTAGSATALGSSFDGTFVANNATFALVNGITVNGETLVLNSTSATPLDNRGGHNIWNGPVRLDQGSSINVAAGWSLQILGVISGSGSLTKSGLGTLWLGGPASNTHVGNTFVNEGELLLNKSAGFQAVPANLVIGQPNGSTTALVRHFNTDCIWGDITVNHGGLLDLNGYSEYIGTLSLNGGGDVQTVAGTLHLFTTLAVNPGNFADQSVISGKLGLYPGTMQFTVGAGSQASGNADCLVSAAISQTSTTAGIQKMGDGMLHFTGTNTYTGVTTLFGGTLQVDGVQLQSAIQVYNGARLQGSGFVGNVSLNERSGVISPGTSTGILNTKSFHLGSPGLGTLQIELNGVGPSQFDQVKVTGTVNLTGVALNRSLNFPSAVGNQFVIIDNDNADAVTGTFTGLPQNAQLYIGGEKFSISYTGGTGNDVVLTRVFTPAPPLLEISRVSTNSVRVFWSTVETNFTFQVATNLSSPVWLPGSTPTKSGENYTVTNTITGTQRYFRLVTP